MMGLQQGTSLIKITYFMHLVLNVFKKVITSKLYEYFTNQATCLNTNQQGLLPVSLLIPRYTQNVHNRQVLMALIESGGTISFIHKHVLLTEVASSISTNQIFTSLAGEFHSDRQVLLQDTVLLEFIYTACVESHTCQALIGLCSYDNILG